MKICESSGITPLSLGIAFVLGGAIGAEAAVLPAYSLTGSPTNDPFTNGVTLGLQFRVDGTEPIDVVQIGAYLRGSDGDNLVVPRIVTLWDEATEASIFSTTITPGAPNTTPDGAGDFLYLDLTATGDNFPLPPGLYRISSFIDAGTQGDNALFTDLIFSTPLIGEPDPNGVQASGQAYPGDLQPGLYRVSANLLFDDQSGGNGPGPSVPEPSLVGGLILFGLAGLWQKRNH